MNCEEFERGWQDSENPAELTPRLEKHRQECPTCAELVEDLNSITQQARTMIPLGHPPDRMWEQIREELESEGLIKGLIHEAPVRRSLVSVPVLGWLPRLPMGLAYAAVFLLAVGVVYLQHRSTNPAVSPSFVSAPQTAGAVEMTVPELPSQVGEEEIRQLVQKVPPERREIYVTQLDRVNTAIEQWRAFMLAHPEDPFAREQLFTAFEHRKRLWETMVKWEEF